MAGNVLEVVQKEVESLLITVDNFHHMSKGKLEKKRTFITSSNRSKLVDFADQASKISKYMREDLFSSSVSVFSDAVSLCKGRTGIDFLLKVLTMMITVLHSMSQDGALINRLKSENLLFANEVLHIRNIITTFDSDIKQTPGKISPPHSLHCFPDRKVADSKSKSFDRSDLWMIRSLATALLNVLDHPVSDKYWGDVKFLELMANLDEGYESMLNDWSAKIPKLAEKGDIDHGDCLELALFVPDGNDTGIRILLTKVGSYTVNINANEHAANVFITFINRTFDLTTLIIHSAIRVVEGVLLDAPKFVALQLLHAEHVKIYVDVVNADSKVPFPVLQKPSESELSSADLKDYDNQEHA